MLALFPLLVTCNCYLNLYSWLSWAARFMRMISINLNNYLVIKIHTSWCHAAYWFPRSSKLFHTKQEYNGVGQELLFYWIIFILKQIISAERSLHAYFFWFLGKKSEGFGTCNSYMGVANINKANLSWSSYYIYLFCWIVVFDAIMRGKSGCSNSILSLSANIFLTSFSHACIKWLKSLLLRSNVLALFKLSSIHNLNMYIWWWVASLIVMLNFEIVLLSASFINKG